MDALIAAYLAGAMDSDGCFTIKRSTQRVRLARDCVSATYSPHATLGQVTPEVPALLKRSFGGMVYLQPPATRNSKALHKYLSSDAVATSLCRALLPYLRIKKERAAVLISLWEWKHRPELKKPSYWWLRDHPHWQDEELVTSVDVMASLGYSGESQVSQALESGTLIALPGRTGRSLCKRFPKSLIAFLVSLQSRGKRRRYISPPGFVAGCHSMYETIRSMNTIGINGTSVNHRTGHFAPK